MERPTTTPFLIFGPVQASSETLIPHQLKEPLHLPLVSFVDMGRAFA